jgi:Carboxypeptidase regulatory-like domain
VRQPGAQNQELRLRKRLIYLLFPFLPLVGCGGGSSSPAPSPTPSPPPAPTTFTLRGQVSEAAPFSSNKIAGAKVEFMDGTNAGRSAITDNAGNYVITNANGGGFTVRASAGGFTAFSAPVTLTANAALDFALSPAGPRTKFGPGQYRVNTDIAPGRYYAVPSSGCYFERQSGLGGTLDDIIANEFISFDAGQWIVDIKSSDLAFETDEDCGVWFNSPRAGKQSSIPPGMWLVGSQIGSGTYRAATSPGCYWERLRNFSNTIGGVIANDFVSGGGAKLVSIRSSDLGFSTDEDCGTWTKSSSATSVASKQSPTEMTQTSEEIERNWLQHHRQQNGPRAIVPRWEP